MIDATNPVVITGDQFKQTFKPMRNPRHPESSVYGFDEQDLKAVVAAHETDPLRVWTVVVKGEDYYLIPTLITKHRSGFYVTEIPAPHKFILVYVKGGNPSGAE